MSGSLQLKRISFVRCIRSTLRYVVWPNRMTIFNSFPLDQLLTYICNAWRCSVVGSVQFPQNDELERYGTEFTTPMCGLFILNWLIWDGPFSLTSTVRKMLTCTREAEIQNAREFIFKCVIKNRSRTKLLGLTDNKRKKLANFRSMQMPMHVSTMTS